jgi:phytoene dehydrogenase-like protein
MALDAIVVGSGPNGLAAAIAIARAGRSVRVYEAQPTLGGGLRSLDLTAPGFVHDVCATVHALLALSPFLSRLPLTDHGVELVHAPAPFAHPLGDGTAVVVDRSVDATADSLSSRDARSYRRLMSPLVRRSQELMEAVLAPPSLRHSLVMARFAPSSIRSAAGLSRACFDDERTRALFAGAAVHGMVPLESLATAGFGLGLLIAAHAVGWPVARGGSQRVADGLVGYLRSLGGEVVTGTRVESLAQLPPSRAVLCDVSPRELVRLAGERMPPRYRHALERYRLGPGVFKMDWALNGPVPWTAEGCRRAGTVHIGGSFAEIADSERAAWEGRVHDRPYVLLVQPSVADPTRAPEGRHTLWAYCHVPNGSPVDMTERIERQIERFAPGFRDCILGTPEREPDRRRHQRRCQRPPADPRASSPLARSVPDAGGRRVPLFVVDPARRRGPRDVRLLRGAVGAATTPVFTRASAKRSSRPGRMKSGNIRNPFTLL